MPTSEHAVSEPPSTCGACINLTACIPFFVHTLFITSAIHAILIARYTTCRGLVQVKAGIVEPVGFDARQQEADRGR